MTTFGSVCSGIEAASVAWGPLGWEPLWFSEIEKFPCQVLAYRYPDTPNVGDMTRIAGLIRSGIVEAPDVLVGGTPCQAFSIAGLRLGLADDRGQLTISYGEILDAIDEQRPGDEAICVWENVPGVLSDKTNAFGCFLALLAGESSELLPPGRSWPNAGCVFGPKRRIAWRVLDAQFHGLAQRRRRVFVVASARDGFNPAEILFESEGLRRDSAPLRNEKQKAPSPADGGVSFTGSWWDGGQVSQTLDAVLAKGQMMPEKNRFPCVVVHGTQDPITSDDIALPLGRNSGQENAVMASIGVRKLTPVECERLQGFPDNWTNIPGASDTARYKALGNSMAVPVMAWIGRRIEQYFSDIDTTNSCFSKLTVID